MRSMLALRVVTRLVASAPTETGRGTASDTLVVPWTVSTNSGVSVLKATILTSAPVTYSAFTSTEEMIPEKNEVKNSMMPTMSAKIRFVDALRRMLRRIEATVSLLYLVVRGSTRRTSASSRGGATQSRATARDTMSRSVEPRKNWMNWSWLNTRM